jgi:3',5'-cyclic AMP phosphodiesterase CpdA
MNKTLVRALQVIGIIAIALVVIYSGIGIAVYSSTGRFPVKRTMYPPVRIQNLAWPTIGYPALVTGGSSLEVEFDFNQVGRGGGAQPEGPTGWQAVLRPSRSALRELSYDLKPLKSWMEISGRWPVGTSRGAPYRVWHAEFQLPADASPELYDLTVEASVGEKRFSDTQPHSVSVAEKLTGDFRFMTLSDIHVHRRNISGFFSEQTDKGITPEGRPVFFERAIEQVNLIRPDFVILLGDFVRAQRSPGDYQIEFENFYHALSLFEVPVFTVPGNHDQYINEVDGAVIWEESLGPLHYSFDVADCHFAAVNTTEWPRSDRVVMEKLNLFVYPRKWQGQVLDAQDEKKVSCYDGQLGWLRDDLAAHKNSKLRVMLMHHDPFVPDGEGQSFENERFAGVYTLGGDGKGKVALRELASTYNVAIVFTGHLHSDDLGRIKWKDGSGETVFANQTCVYYDEGGVQEAYPGYRLVEVEKGALKSFAYLDEYHSIPFYDGSVLNGETDLDNLDRPAVSAAEFILAGRPVTGHEVPTGTGVVVTRAGWEVKNYLGIPMDLRGLVMEVPYSPNGYDTSAGEIYRVTQLQGSSRVLLYARIEIGKGIPGKSATRPGIPAQIEVTVYPLVTSQRNAAVALPR